MPAVGGAAAVDRAAGAALAVNSGLGGAQQAFDLTQLSVGLLQLGGTSGEHVESIVVANRHLIGESAQIPGEPGNLFGERQAPGA